MSAPVEKRHRRAVYELNHPATPWPEDGSGWGRWFTLGGDSVANGLGRFSFRQENRQAQALADAEAAGVAREREGGAYRRAWDELMAILLRHDESDEVCDGCVGIATSLRIGESIIQRILAEELAREEKS